MPAGAVEQEKIRSDISVLQQEVAQVTALVPSLDPTIEKLTEVSSNVPKLLAVHEQRLDQVDRMSFQYAELLERIREKNEDAHGELHEKINNTRTDLEEKIEEAHKQVISEIKTLRTEYKNSQETLSKRISKLERWIWFVSGGGVVIGFILSHVVSYFTK